MGCGCGGGAKAALKGVQKYQISDDPQSREFLTEREALSVKTTDGLKGDVQPVK